MAIRAQVRAAWSGHKVFDNGTAWLIGEYNQRMRLRKIGVTQNIETLDAFRGEAFLIISETISEIEEQQRKKQEKSRR